MYRKNFCEINQLKKMIASRQSWPDVIINATTRSEYRDNIEGTLTVFSNIKGVACYGAGNVKTKIGADTFFISNEHQLYSIEIKERVETFNIHFSTAMLRKMLPAILLSDEQLLDNISPDINNGWHFYNKQYWKDEYFRNTVSLLQSKSVAGELGAMMTEEVLAVLLQHLLYQHNKINRNASLPGVIKSATRIELFERLDKAVEYIYQHYNTTLSLDELSIVACMSKFHFLRTFRQVYGKTPYQYITEIRVDKARSLLAGTQMTVADIAIATGYDSAATFCRVFKRKSGLWPQAYRLALQ